MYKVLSLCFIALMLVNVIGRPVTSEPWDFLKTAILTDIKILRKFFAEDEGKLYTPENIDVMCAREAMICYVKEIGALAQESDNRTIITTIGRIQRNIGAALNYTANTNATGQNSSQQPSEPSNVTLAPFTSRKEKDNAAKTKLCLQCESHERQKTTTFLECMIQFVQLAMYHNGLKTLG